MESQINLELLKKSMQPIKRELEAKEDLSKIARTEFIPYDKSSNWRDLI